jgi:hypothetical protein
MLQNAHNNQPNASRKGLDSPAFELVDDSAGSSLVIVKPGHHAMPLVMANSALFHAGINDNPEPVKDLVIASTPNWTVTTTGFRLSQADLYIFTRVVSTAWELIKNGFAMPNITVSPTTFAGTNANGNKSGFYIDQARASIDRLIATRIEVWQNIPNKSKPRKTYSGSLLAAITYDRDLWQIEISGSIAELFGRSDAIGFDPIVRAKIRSPLELWLINHFDANADSSVFDVDNLHLLSGSKSKSKTSITQQIEQALERLREKNLLSSFTRRARMIYIVRPPESTKTVSEVKSLTALLGQKAQIPKIKRPHGNESQKELPM